MMRQTFVAAAAAVTLLAGSLALSAIAPAVSAATPTNPATALDLGVQAYEYGLPLLEFERVRREETSVSCPDHVGNAPVNTFANANKFLDPSFKDVVAPNTDTLYSIAQLDLSKGPIVLSHPAMGQRYYSFAMLDPYTNVVATPGAREDGPGAASIEVRWTGRPGRADPQRFSRVVTTSYRHLWVIGRTLATTLADQRRAYALMRSTPSSRCTDPPRESPRNCPPEQPKKYPVPTSGPAFVAQLNRALADNPPPARDRPLLRQLRPYGIGAGLSPERAGLDPVTLAALYRGVSTQAALLPRPPKPRSSLPRPPRRAGTSRRPTSATTAPTTTSAR